MEHLQVKSLFYGFVHELLRQLSASGSAGSSPDLVTQAMRYIHEHYEQAIAMEDLAQLLDCSVSYMSRVFKAQVGTSPNDYLIQVRIGHARKRLASSEWSLQKIALSVGYSDVYYFSRLFKKQTGLSPVQYRKRVAKEREVQHNPFASSPSSIAPEDLFPYSGTDNENHYYEKGEIEAAMYRTRKPSMAAVMLLCLTLFLSACQREGTRRAMPMRDRRRELRLRHKMKRPLGTTATRQQRRECSNICMERRLFRNSPSGLLRLFIWDS
ncbi:AraC family transcriptional regulator [Paenibacillus hemerocallicola]|uniref:AraC family transcriptional regulator n=1 Tax=Paenibacillus hemerocallicola TaxID=1172614 RepID=UPI00159EC2F6|nr:AraC family transcriptional regulator [Paenibacillus hemerocallicola]